MYLSLYTSFLFSLPIAFSFAFLFLFSYYGISLLRVLLAFFFLSPVLFCVANPVILSPVLYFLSSYFLLSSCCLSLSSVFCILLYFSSHFGLVQFPSLLPVSINHSCLLPFRCFSFIAFPRPRLVCPFVRSQLHFLLILIPLHNRLPFLSYFARQGCHAILIFRSFSPSLSHFLIPSFVLPPLFLPPGIVKEDSGCQNMR